LTAFFSTSSQASLLSNRPIPVSSGKKGVKITFFFFLLCAKLSPVFRVVLNWLLPYIVRSSLQFYSLKVLFGEGVSIGRFFFPLFRAVFLDQPQTSYPLPRLFFFYPFLICQDKYCNCGFLRKSRNAFFFPPPLFSSSSQLIRLWRNVLLS